MNRVEKLKNKIIDIQLKIEKFQSECPHKNETNIRKGDTGNWCKQDDRYWTAHYCPDCQKSWETEQ